MKNLYDYLLSEELKKAELEACRLRFLVLGILAAGFFLSGSPVPAALILMLGLLNGAYLLLMTRGGRHLPTLPLIILETGLVSLGILMLREIDLSGSLTILYLVILYSASLRLRDGLIFFTGVLVVSAMNLIFLFNLFAASEVLPESPFHWPGFANQLALTLTVLVFTVTLLSRPHSIKGILKNQQNYFDSLSSENYSLLDSMADFCREYELSERESEVLGVLIGGKTYRMIGSDLFISVETVKSHVRSIYRKTSSEGKADLIRKLRNYALARGTHSD